MWYALAICIISAAALFFFLSVRVRALRTGTLRSRRAEMTGHTPVSIAEAEELVRRTFRAGGRLVILYVLKYSVSGMRFVKQKFDAGMAKAYRFAAHHEKKIVAAHNEDVAPGRFLETISEYKSKLARPKKRSSSANTSV